MNKLWQNIDGWKTFSGGLLHAVWFGIYIYGHITKKFEISDGLQIRGHLIIGVWTGVGLYGKYQKNKETINNSINKTLNVFKKK